MNVDPSHILQIGSGFWPSKVLLSAVELELFTHLVSWDFLDGLVALGLLDREGEGRAARDRITQDTAVFLDKSSPEHIGGVLEMQNARLFRFWADLTDALKTGEPPLGSANEGWPRRWAQPNRHLAPRSGRWR